MKTLSRKFCAC